MKENKKTPPQKNQKEKQNLTCIPLVKILKNPIPLFKMEKTTFKT